MIKHSLYSMQQDLHNKAQETLDQNKECYIAGIILANPDINLLEYTLTYWTEYVVPDAKFCMKLEKR